MEKILNIGILAHVDAGKTTLTENILFDVGKSRNIGSVDNGTAKTDWLEIEKQRGISVSSAFAYFKYDDYLINLLDTPGHIDFAGEVERVLAVLDGAILVVSAVEGIEAQTENIINALKNMNIPTIVFINKIDRSGSRVFEIIKELENRFSLIPQIFSKIENEGEKNANSTLCEFDEKFKEELILNLAMFDDEILEKLENSLSAEYLFAKLKENNLLSKITPIVFGSAINNIGVKDVLQIATLAFPQKNQSTDELSALIFKIEHTKQMGKVCHVRMFGGSLKNRDTVFLPRVNDDGEEENIAEKITQIRKFNGKQFEDTGKVLKGDIAGLCGLANAKIGDFFGKKSEYNAYSLVNPFLKVRILPQNYENLTPFVEAFSQLCEEDPSMNFLFLKDEREMQINITGKIQLEILKSLIKERYNLEVEFSPPCVIYKETPKNIGRGFEAYTMPKPCWAVVQLDVEPREAGYGFSFSSTVKNNEMFYRYQNHVKKSLSDYCLKQGIYGWEVTDLHVTLSGGEHHTIHTHPLDFFLATPIAFLRALENSGSTLLEPILNVRIFAPEEFLGKIIGDITLMRGEFDTPIINKGAFTVECLLPVATSIDYQTILSSITGGKGNIFSSFYGYKEILKEMGQICPRRGVDPRDRAKWILYKRGAIQ